jgi:microsomal dipeptidase-like Zn-dependent dipeptidase
MPEASAFPWMGSFNDALRAKDYSSHLRTRVNADALERSNVKIVVLALYSHPLFLRAIVGGQRASIRYQIQEAHRFVASHSEWVIAKSPDEARAALLSGKRVIVLAIEGAQGVLESPSDVQEFIDQDGVRIVTPFHFVDNSLGGSSFLRSYQILMNPIAAIRSFFLPRHDDQGVRINSEGLTPKGSRLLTSLVQKGIWLDLSHASDASFRDLLPILHQAHQPVLFSHTILRNDMRAERGISDDELREVANSGGLVGLLPSDDYLIGTKVDPRLCADVCHGQCNGGEAAYATQFAQIDKTVPAERVLLGSDVDAPLNFLKPECDAQARINSRGYWSYAQFPELFEFLRKKGVIPSSLGDDYMVKSFLSAWEKAYRPHD